MADAASITGLPRDVVKDILLQIDSIQDLKAASQSCKMFHLVVRAQPSIIHHVLKNEIPAPLLPYAYALLKCEWERYGMAFDEDKTALINNVFDGKTEFWAFFPDLKLRWAKAFEISKFFQLVKRLTCRSEKFAFGNMENELKNNDEHGNLEAFRTKGLKWSDTERLRVFLTFYRVELHTRLFATTFGSRMSPEMERMFLLKLKPWECEQLMILWRWMIDRTWQKQYWINLFRRKSTVFGKTTEAIMCCRPDCGLSKPYSLPPVLEPFTDCSGAIWGGSVLLEDRTKFHYDSGHATNWHMHGVTENLAFEEPSELADPELGPRNAVFAVYRDLRTYNDLPLMDEEVAMAREDARLKVDSLFHAFWDYSRIADADLLPLFASLAFSHDRGVWSESGVYYDDENNE